MTESDKLFALDQQFSKTAPRQVTVSMTSVLGADIGETNAATLLIYSYAFLKLNSAQTHLLFAVAGTSVSLVIKKRIPYTTTYVRTTLP
jgi:hypothetical protein